MTAKGLLVPRARALPPSCYATGRDTIQYSMQRTQTGRTEWTVAISLDKIKLKTKQL